MYHAPFAFVLGSFVVSCSAKVPRLPQPAESLTAQALTVEVGGKGFNVALGLVRLGSRVDGLFAVGGDPFGELAEPTLQRAGLSSQMVRRYAAATGGGVGFTDAAGENCLAVYPGANLLLSAQDVRGAEIALRGAGLVYAQFEIGDEPIVEAFTLARQAGVRTILNPSPFRPIEERILRNTSILVVNEGEAAQVALGMGLAVTVDGARPWSGWMEGLADVLADRGPQAVVVTLGERGAVVLQRGRSPLFGPALPIDPIDTLGAGDAFTAGLASSLLQGHSLSQALRRANACGGLATRRLGVFDALPTGDELEQALALSV